MNNNYYIYKLARTQDKTSYHNVDVDLESTIGKEAIYYGLTSDPKDRLSKHRAPSSFKGKDTQNVGLIVMAIFDNVWEALEHESHLVAKHYREFGEVELQGEASTGNKGYQYGGNK